MSNFSGLALSRMEMKKVTGGCSAQTSGGNTTCAPSQCADIAANGGGGGHWCCASCGNATWL